MSENEKLAPEPEDKPGQRTEGEQGGNALATSESANNDDGGDDAAS